jgi:hypothetical protein
MKAYWGVDIYFHAFLTSGLMGVVSFTPLISLSPGDRVPGTHSIGGEVDPRDAQEKKIPSLFVQGIVPRPSNPQTSLCTY